MGCDRWSPYAAAVTSDSRADATFRRSLVPALLGGAWWVLVEAVTEGRWPSYTLQRWLVMVSGLVVIAAVAYVAESVYRAKKRAGDADTTEP